jgi:hypothetical protein
MPVYWVFQGFLEGYAWMKWKDVPDWLKEYDEEVYQCPVRETLIKPHSSPQGGLNLIHENAGLDDSASLPF